MHERFSSELTALWIKMKFVQNGVQSKNSWPNFLSNTHAHTRHNDNNLIGENLFVFFSHT